MKKALAAMILSRRKLGCRIYLVSLAYASPSQRGISSPIHHRCVVHFAHVNTLVFSMVQRDDSWYQRRVLEKLLRHQSQQLDIICRADPLAFRVDPRFQTLAEVMQIHLGVGQRLLTNQQITGFDGRGREESQPRRLCRAHGDRADVGGAVQQRRGAPRGLVRGG